MDRAVIEEGSADLVVLFDRVSEEAKIEKLGNAKPAISKIHYWWTRKPLTVGRAVALAATLQKVEDVEDFLKLGREKRAHTYDPDRELYAKRLGRDPSLIKVLDPFSGAGSLLYEAKRLGLQCHSMDYNPVAYLIEKAVLEYPAKYGEKLADDVEKYGKDVIERTRKEIGHLYGRDGRPAVAYLWAWCMRCPYCSQRMPLMNQMWFAKTGKSNIGVVIKPSKDLNFTVELVRKMKAADGSKFTQKGGKAVCIKCKNSISYEQMTDDIRKMKDRELLGVVVKGANGKDYESTSDSEKKKFDRARKMLAEEWEYLLHSDLVPTDEIRPGHRREHTLWHYGIRVWNEYFNERQLLVMATMLKNVRKVSIEIAKNDREYAGVMATYLAFLISKHIDYNSLEVIS